MSFHEKISEAMKSVKRSFKEGDKVFIKNQINQIPYIIKSVNYLSYDLKLDVSKTEIDKCKKIMDESFEMVEFGFENREERLKKNPPYTMEEIIKAEDVVTMLYVYNISEENLKLIS